MAIAKERKGEPMKGLLNNGQAVKVLNNLKGSLDNRIHEIYNLGYKQGYEDGEKDGMQAILQRLMEGSSNMPNVSR